MCTSPTSDREILYQVSKISELPPLPQSIQRLIEIVQDEVNGPDELESIIGYDQAIAAKVLKIANSSIYGFRKSVRDISRALLIIGFEQAKSICLSSLLMNMFSNTVRIDPELREQLWKHAFTTSRIAVEIAKRRSWISAGEASVLGLIHDIGHLAMAAYFAEQFNSILKTAENRKCPPWFIELQTGFSHAEIGKYLAIRWALPDSFQAVIEFHHSPGRCHEHKAETRLVHIADAISNSPYYPYLMTDEAILASCREIYLSEEDFQECAKKLEYIRPEVDMLWDLLK